MAEIEVLDADITTLEVDAIANAANTELKHGGGVAGAISRAGGPTVQEESDAVAPIGLGDAVETGAGEMPSRWVIHAATMKLGGPTSAEIIRRATARTLMKAEELGARSLALVAFGTGVGGFPLSDAARIEVEEVRRHLASASGLERVVFSRSRCGRRACVRGRPGGGGALNATRAEVRKEREVGVTTLELFFDLVFVFTITQLTALLAHHPTGEGLLQVTLMLGFIWWMYAGYSWLTNAVTPDRTAYRLALLAGMACWLVISLTIPGAFSGDGEVAFAAAYIVVVIIHAGLFTRARVRSAATAILRVARFNLTAGRSFSPGRSSVTSPGSTSSGGSGSP